MRIRRWVRVAMCPVNVVLLLAGLATIIGCVAFLHNRSEAQQLAEKQWQDLKSQGVLRVGIDPGSYPYSFYTDDGWQGLDAELATEIARRMGLALQSNPVGYDSMYDALHLWQVDCVISAITVDNSRLDDYAYTRAYFDAGERLIDARETNRTGLVNKRIAVVLGTDGDRVARQIERRTVNLQRESVDTVDEALKLLRSRSVDAVLLDARSALGFAQRESQYQAILIRSVPYTIATRRDNPLLLNELNRILDDMERDGTLSRIVSRWYAQ